MDMLVPCPLSLVPCPLSLAHFRLEIDPQRSAERVRDGAFPLGLARDLGELRFVDALQSLRDDLQGRGHDLDARFPFVRADRGGHARAADRSTFPAYGAVQRHRVARGM